MSGVGYKRKLLALEIMSASPPGADIPGGVAEDPLVIQTGHSRFD